MKRVLVGRIWIRIDKKRGGGASPRLARFLYYFSPWFFGCVCRRVWVCEESEQMGMRGETDGLDLSGRQDRAARERRARGSVTWRGRGVASACARPSAPL